MIYSSSVLFFGFAIFIFSTFGGTSAVGIPDLVHTANGIALQPVSSFLPSFLASINTSLPKGSRSRYSTFLMKRIDIELEELEN